jgi:hypothetical protein
MSNLRVTGTSRSLAAASLALGLILAPGCGGAQHYAPNSTATAPGADPGITVEVSKETHMARVAIDIPNLAPPDRLATGGSTFVAWYRRDDTMPWQRMGALAYDETERRGRLTATVPEIAFDLVVSVEGGAAVGAPSTTLVTKQHVSK